MKLISTLIFLLCVTFAFAECYDNHFDECRIERQNGKYGIVIDNSWPYRTSTTKSYLNTTVFQSQESRK